MNPLDPSATDPVRPKRRVRYSGKNPRRFDEKYKEHDPVRYAADVAKVVAGGKTPPASHRARAAMEGVTMGMTSACAVLPSRWAPVAPGRVRPGAPPGLRQASRAARMSRQARAGEPVLVAEGARGKLWP